MEDKKSKKCFEGKRNQNLNQETVGLFLIYGAGQKKGRARSVLKAKAGLGNERPLSHGGNKQESMYKSKDFFSYCVIFGNW